MPRDADFCHILDDTKLLEDNLRHVGPPLRRPYALIAGGADVSRGLLERTNFRYPLACNLNGATP